MSLLCEHIKSDSVHVIALIHLFFDFPTIICDSTRQYLSDIKYFPWHTSIKILKKMINILENITLS